LGLQRDRSWLVEAYGLEVPVGTGVQECFEAAVVGAALPQVEPIVTDVDLGVQDDLADGADALGVYSTKTSSRSTLLFIGMGPLWSRAG
jgi:hypothetical protein